MSVFGEGMDLCGVEDRSNSLEGGVASSGDVASSGGMASSGDVVLSGGTKELSESVTASPPGSSLNAKPPPILPLNAPTPITTPTKETQENAGIASFSSCVFNVANQIIGAGILTIPYSIHGAGIYGSALMAPSVVCIIAAERALSNDRLRVHAQRYLWRHFLRSLPSMGLRVFRRVADVLQFRDLCLLLHHSVRPGG